MTPALSSSHHPLETAHAWALGLLVFILPIPGTVALRLSLLVVLLGSTLWLQKIGHWERRQWVGLRYILPWLIACVLGVYWATQRGYALGELKTEVGYGLLAFWLGLQAIQTHYQRTALRIGITAGWLLSVLIGIAVVYTGIAWEMLPITAKTGRTANLVSYWLLTLPVLYWLLISPNQYGGLGNAKIWSRWIGLVITLAALIFASNQRIGLPIHLLFMFVGTAWLFFILYQRRLSTRSWLLLALIALCLTGIGLQVQVQMRWGTWAVAWQNILHDPRLDFWRVLIQKLMEQPFHGFGFGRETMKMALLDLVRFKDSLWHPHNLFIAYWLYAGLFGLIAILWLFVGFFIYCWRVCRLALAHQNQAAATTAFAAGGLLLAVALRNLTNDMWVRDNSLLFWLLLGCLLGYLQQQTRVTGSEKTPEAESNIR